MTLLEAPIISIIVPVFNVEPYLEKCIDSIISQTFSDFELILVNDGSKDNSGRICDEYSLRDARINVVHKMNGGQSLARNVGIDIARGDYLSFIDSDDYIAPAMIQTLYDLVIQHNADIAECGYKSVFDDKEIGCEFGKDIEFGEGDYLTEKYIKGDIFYGVVTKLFKKSLFDNLRFPCGRIYEDTWMTLNFCLDNLKYVRTQEQLYFYYQGNHSTLRSEVSPRKAREYIYILENQLSLIDKKVADYGLKERLVKRIMEKSVFWYLGLALSEKKTLRIIYSKLYLRRMDYSISKCLRSVNIPFKNKLSYTFCKAGLNGPVLIIKNLLT